MAKTAPSTTSESPPPPPYSPTDHLPAQLARINLTDLHTSSAFPTSSQVICHLKLLHAIHNLRQEISSRNGLFGINDCPKSHVYGADSDLGKALAKLQDLIREKRWAVFVARAVDRFTVWWDVMKAREGATPLTVRQINGDFPKKAISGPNKRDGRWLMNAMPPLDVLMIWHCFMLNPTAYHEDCLRQGMTALWNREMPWTAINAVIDNVSGAFVPGEAAKASWKESTELAWDNIDDSDLKGVSCPNCQSNRSCAIFRPPQVIVPWTNVGKQFDLCTETLLSRPKRPLATPLEDAAEGGTGFADKYFEAKCQSCLGVINHDLLQASRFFEDAKGLQADVYYEQFTFQELVSDEPNLRPMKGVILRSNGVPFAAGNPIKDFYKTQAIPNGIVAGLVNMEEHFFNCREYRSIPAIRDRIDRAVKESLILHFATSARDGFNKGRILPEEHIAIHNMIARYTSNSSPFALDLVGACIEQGVFITKMAGLSWLTSDPALTSNASRLVSKYLRFIDMTATSSRETYTSTLDVDLARYTFKLTPRSYYDYTIQRGAYDGQRPHQEGDMSEAAQLEGFARTCRRYEQKYGEPYSSCVCQRCKTIRAKHASPTSSWARKSGSHSWSLFDPSQPPAENKTHTSSVTKFLSRAYEKTWKGARKDGRAVPSMSVSAEDMDQLPPPYEDGERLQVEGKGKQKEKEKSRVQEKESELEVEVESDLESNLNEKMDEKHDEQTSNKAQKARAAAPVKTSHAFASTCKVAFSQPLANAHSSPSLPCPPNTRKSPGISIYGPSSASYVLGSAGIRAENGGMGPGRRCGGPARCVGCG